MTVCYYFNLAAVKLSCRLSQSDASGMMDYHDMYNKYAKPQEPIDPNTAIYNKLQISRSGHLEQDGERVTCSFDLEKSLFEDFGQWLQGFSEVYVIIPAPWVWNMLREKFIQHCDSSLYLPKLKPICLWVIMEKHPISLRLFNYVHPL